MKPSIHTCKTWKQPENVSRRNVGNTHLSDLFRIPLWINRKFGLFPLLLIEDTLELHFCKMCLFSLGLYVFLLLSPVFFGLLRKEDNDKIFNYISAAEKASNSVALLSIEVLDTLCLIKLIMKRKIIQDFFFVHMGKVASLVTEVVSDERHKSIVKIHKERITGILLFITGISITSYISSVWHFSTKAYNFGFTFEKMLLVNFITLIWNLMYQFRVITFYVWVAMTNSFEIAFVALHVILERQLSKENRHNVWDSHKTKWVIKEFREIQVSLKKFEDLFALQFFNICFTTMLCIVNSWCHLGLLGQNGFSFYEMQNGVAIICSLIVFKASLYFICDASNNVTKEVS